MEEKYGSEGKHGEVGGRGGVGETKRFVVNFTRVLRSRKGQRWSTVSNDQTFMHLLF